MDLALVSVARCLLTAAVGSAVLGIGAVHDVTSAVVEILVWLAAAAWLVFAGRRPLPRRFVVAASLLFAFLCLQLVPMPPSVLAAVSPATRELYRNTVDAVAATPFARSKMPDDSAEGLAETARAARDGILPDSWRTISVSTYTTRRDLLRYLAYGLALWIAATISSPRSLLGAVLGVAVCASVAAIAQLNAGNGRVLWVFESFEGGVLRGDRATGTYVNPDHFAMLAAIGVPIALGWLASLWRNTSYRAHRARPWTSAALGAAVILLVAGLVGSASRAGIIAATLGALTVWWRTRTPPVVSRQMSIAERVEARLKRMAPYVVAVAVVAFGLGYAGPDAQERLDARVDRAVESSDLNLGMRPLLLAATWPMISDFPVAGVGAGNWRHVFPRYEWGALAKRRHNHAHNDYVEWVVETGAAGTMLAVILAIVYGNWARSNRCISADIRWGIVGSIVAVGCHEAVDFGLRVPANALVVAILLGLLCNREWRGSRRRQAVRLERAPMIVPIAVAALACLTTLSAIQIREALAWGRIHAGEQSLSFAAADGETWALLGNNLVAADLGGTARAREAHRTAVALAPTSVSAYEGLLRFAKTPEDRVRVAGAAAYANPVDAASRIRHAALLELAGRPDLALREIESAVSRNPSANAYAWASSTRNEPAPALASALRRGLERALREHPGDVGIASEVASFEQSLGRHERAAEIWLRLAAETGDWGRYGNRAGSSFVRAGLTKRAETAFRRVIGEAPGTAESYRSLALTVLEPAGRLNEADEILERGLRRSRDRRELYLALVGLRERRGDAPGVRKALEHAADWRPRDYRLHFRLGNAYFREGDFHRAKIEYDRALDVKPDHAGIQFMSGRALEKLYDFDRAGAAYRRAVDLAPDNPRYRRALDRIAGANPKKGAA